VALAAAAPLEAHARHCDLPAGAMPNAMPTAMGAMAAHSESREVVRATAPDCPHCPAAECERSLECGSATLAALSTALTPMYPVSAGRVVHGRPGDRFRSLGPLPPTPPPQPVL
jgi:hypothetical protein